MCVCVLCVWESVSISLIIIERRLGLWWCVVWLVERLWATASKYYQQVNSQISPAQYTSREKRSRINFSSLVVYRESMHPAECTLRLSFLVSFFCLVAFCFRFNVAYARRHSTEYFKMYDDTYTQRIARPPYAGRTCMWSSINWLLASITTVCPNCPIAQRDEHAVVAHQHSLRQRAASSDFLNRERRWRRRGLPRDRWWFVLFCFLSFSLCYS